MKIVLNVAKEDILVLKKSLKAFSPKTKRDKLIVVDLLNIIERQEDKGEKNGREGTADC